MDSGSQDILRQAMVWLIPCIPAITLQECAHGWMALCFGDTTARDAKRLSLNPLRHIDPVGTLILPTLMLLAHTPFLFGWAKPVPVDFSRLSHGRWGMICVALAGPLANLVMLCGWLGLTNLIAGDNTAPDSPRELLAHIALSGAAVNLVLMLFNLIPLPPLDGGRILGALLPERIARPYLSLQRYGILILIILIATGSLHTVFDPLLEFFFSRMGM
jgi:Zn-dependent protease